MSGSPIITSSLVHVPPNYHGSTCWFDKSSNSWENSVSTKLNITEISHQLCNDQLKLNIYGFSNKKKILILHLEVEVQTKSTINYRCHTISHFGIKNFSFLHSGSWVVSHHNLVIMDIILTSQSIISYLI